MSADSFQILKLLQYTVKIVNVINKIFFLQLLKDSGFDIVINKISLTTTNTYYNKFIIY